MPFQLEGYSPLDLAIFVTYKVLTPKSRPHPQNEQSIRFSHHGERLDHISPGRCGTTLLSTFIYNDILSSAGGLVRLISYLS